MTQEEKSITIPSVSWSLACYVAALVLFALSAHVFHADVSILGNKDLHDLGLVALALGFILA